MATDIAIVGLNIVSKQVPLVGSAIFTTAMVVENSGGVEGATVIRLYVPALGVATDKVDQKAKEDMSMMKPQSH